MMRRARGRVSCTGPSAAASLGFGTKLSVYEGNLFFILAGEGDFPMKLV